MLDGDHASELINLTSDSNKTALLIAVEKGYADMVRLLLSYPSLDMNHAVNKMSFLRAVSAGNVYIFIYTVFMEYH